MTNELKPCPFCGGEAIIYILRDDTAYSECPDCLIKQGYICLDAEKAAISWNTRPIEDKLNERIAKMEEALRSIDHGAVGYWNSPERSNEVIKNFMKIAHEVLAEYRGEK